ncbi:hypothetical protein ABZY06_33865 [Streptomyces sp. NPDC006540]|uniref:hypothetical protein n=1 Tax=Streptomyces sp. NPDC006540 TaxID=3155353 RepID=UPI0033B57B3F
MGIRTVKRGGSRFYVNPATRVTLPGVTSIIGMAPKTFLPYWYAKMAAELAVDSLDLIRDMEERAGRDAVVSYLKNAAPRYTKARAALGSEAHDLFERMIRGEGGFTERDERGRFVVSVHKDLAPYRANFAEFLEVVRPVLVGAEDIAWSDTHGYAGSFDAFLEIMLSEDAAGNLVLDHEHGRPFLVIDDWKTSKAAYPDVALQLSAYANADVIIRADGTRVPMPKVDGAAVLHITDTAWEFKPVEIGPAVFAVFLALRTVFDWDRDLSKDVLGRPIARGGRSISGTERRS